ncbi:MAG: NAD(P)-dependent dehydrogenase (short-subunit alcohol dehydrogenase family) [Bacteroidia bacterium]|jgi:NAD(P)-dependent dehydrogenase (short-subunit alcohol dehydrogenase family)
MPRFALVTGASSGIGEATAKLLASEGYSVALLARRREPLERVLAELPACEGGHVVVTCDLMDATSIASAAVEVSQIFGGLDLVVCNAGVGYRALVEELDDDLLDAVFATNVLGPMRLARELLPILRLSERAVWVNVSSVVGRRGIPGQAAYSATKAALGSFAEALRLEWATEGKGGIAVCTLNPALTATGFFEAQPNPGALPNPDLAGAAGPMDVAREILKLDKNPEPERSLRWKWWLLGALTPIFPRLSDRMLAKKLGGGWQAPSR